MLGSIENVALEMIVRFIFVVSIPIALPIRYALTRKITHTSATKATMVPHIDTSGHCLICLKYSCVYAPFGNPLFCSKHFCTIGLIKYRVNYTIVDNVVQIYVCRLSLLTLFNLYVIINSNL